MKRGKHKTSVAPDPGGDGYGYLRRRGLSSEEIARGHNQGVGHNSGERDDKPKRRKADDLAGKDSLADAMRKRRRAIESGNPGEGRKVMREFFTDEEDD